MRICLSHSAFVCHTPSFVCAIVSPTLHLSVPPTHFIAVAIGAATYVCNL